MGKYFSDVVEQAIADLYYCYDSGRAKAAADALFLAAKAGDGDASYFLSRCFSGVCYSWDYHPFEENEAAAYAMLHQGISQGSAVAVLGALRIDMLTPELRETMPFSSLHEAWEIVYQKADDGCPFCQYMIGNTYYFLDVIEIEDQKESAFPSREAWNDWKREQVKNGIPWLCKAYSGGMGMAGRNLYRYYKSGRGELIPPDPDKAQEVVRQGAERGYLDWMDSYAVHLYYAGQKKEALSWALKSAQGGQLHAWSLVGDIYQEGQAVDRDLAYALECYEKTAPYGDDAYACDRAASMYFFGHGTQKDYAKAVQYLERCYMLTRGDTDTDLLGLCYLMGWGCQRDPARGRKLLERPVSNRNSKRYQCYGLGMMYAEGIGVPENIEKGVEYLKAAGDYPPAREALKHYKKSLFGVWRRR